VTAYTYPGLLTPASTKWGNGTRPPWHWELPVTRFGVGEYQPLEGGMDVHPDPCVLWTLAGVILYMASQ
jgi:hypothetical protein